MVGDVELNPGPPKREGTATYVGGWLLISLLHVTIVSYHCSYNTNTYYMNSLTARKCINCLRYFISWPGTDNMH